MAQPSYKVELINIVKTNMVSQLSGANLGILGATNIAERRGQDFIATANAILRTVRVKLLKFGTPTDNLIMKLYASDKSTLLQTSLTIINGSKLSSSTEEFFDFIFKYDLVNTTTYFIELYRSGSLDASNYYRQVSDSTNPYTSGSAWVYNTSGSPIWNIVTNWDAVFVLETEAIDTIDISDDVHSISNINTGLNGVYGSIKQGEVLLTLNNDDSKYSPLNDSSSLFGKFRLNNQMKIEVTFNAITYNLFTGIIENIEPLMNINKRKVDVRLLDLFSRFKEETVSIGIQTGKTASQLIELLLATAGLWSTEYSIESDPEVLRDVTWNDVNLISKLNEIVETGQHYHFIDGNGIYQFKTNQFLSSDVPEFTYDDVNNDPDSIKQQYKLSDIKNIIDVEYTGSLFERSTDESSRFLYNDRLSTLENNLIDSQDYAGFIADYLLSLQANAGNIIEIDLSLLYPDIFKIDFGTVIKIIDNFHNLDNVYNVLERTFARLPNGNTILKSQARKFVFPPEIGTILEPFQDDADITIPSPSTFLAFLQGFKVANDGALVTMIYKIIMTNSSTIRVTPAIQELDVSGFPTGPILATGNFIDFPSPGFTGDVIFQFPADQRPTLVTTKTYGCRVFASLSFPTSLKLRGKTTDVYANGKPAYTPTGGPWTTLHPNDFYFKALIKEV